MFLVAYAWYRYCAYATSILFMEVFKVVKELLNYPEYREGEELDSLELAQQDELIHAVENLVKIMALDENCEEGSNAEVYGDILDTCQEALYKRGIKSYYPGICYDDDNDTTLVYTYWDPSGDNKQC